MREIRKKLLVTVYDCLFYDKVAKQERAESVEVTEVSGEIKAPENCVLLEKKKVSEKEVTFRMTPERFVELATRDAE